MAHTMTTVDGNPLISNSNYAIVLGGGSKGALYLSKCFSKYSTTHIECIHLRTKDALKIGHKTYTKRFKQRNITIIAICPMTDSLIPFCDAMCKVWNLPFNDPKTSEMRRNKALMHKTISESHQNKMGKVKKYFKNIMHTNDDSKTEETDANQMRHGKFFEINTYLTSKTEFETKMRETDLEYPIVIKPPTSGGTDGVRLCYTFEAAQRVIKKHLFQENSEKNTNVSMMCQEFLNGEEYVINSVSYNGEHKISDVWIAKKTFLIDRDMTDMSDEKSESDLKMYPYSMLYDYQQFIVDLNAPKMKQIIKYVCDILPILGVKYGCAHTEVIYLAKEDQTCLVELNARCGGGIPRATELVGYDQYGLCALASVNYTRFLSEIPSIYGQQSRANVSVYGGFDDELEQNKSANEISVRVIFLQSQITKGKIDFLRLTRLERELITFEKWARELVYVDLGLWLKFRVKLMLAQQKLSIVTATENAKYAQMDLNGAYAINNSEMDFLESQKEECAREIAYLQRTVSRIESIEKTVDLVTSPGAIVLRGRVCDICTDFECVRLLEKDTKTGIFVTNDSSSDGICEQKQNKDNSNNQNLNIDIASFVTSIHELMQEGQTLSEAQMIVQLSLQK